MIRWRKRYADCQSWHHTYHQPVGWSILTGLVERRIAVQVDVKDVVGADRDGSAATVGGEMLEQMGPIAVIYLERVLGVE